VIERYRVGPEFLDFYRIPLLRGRMPGPDDPPNSVAIGERLAQVFWPGQDPLGRTFSSSSTPFHVVGLVGEINLPSVDARVDRPEFYEPFDGVGSYALLSLRCGAACPSPAVIRQRLGSSLAGIRVEDVEPLENAYVAQLAPPRAAAALALAFATIALVAAAGGLFSVLSYAVGRRRREFGIRTALGASAPQIRRLVLRDGAVVAVAGLGLGVLASWIVARALASLEYGVTASDPVSWAVVLGVVTLTIGLASWRPAGHSGRLDPLMLIRDEEGPTVGARRSEDADASGSLSASSQRARSPSAERPAPSAERRAPSAERPAP
jgi:putative ABC transport system permease protein